MSVIVAKSIKASRLKDDAMRLKLLNAMRKDNTETKRDFESTTATWEHEVKFQSEISLALGGPASYVWTDDEIYRYVDLGTRPHEIWAGFYTGKSDKKVLAFPSAFAPKTTPNVLGSQAGSSGGPTVFTPYVQHPGTKPRNFSKLIQKKAEPRFKRNMEQGMREAARASGHG